jgi:hypothetical protein
MVIRCHALAGSSCSMGAGRGHHHRRSSGRQNHAPRPPPGPQIYSAPGSLPPHPSSCGGSKVALLLLVQDLEADSGSGGRRVAASLKDDCRGHRQ